MHKGKLSLAGPRGATLFEKFYPGGTHAVLNMSMFDFKLAAAISVNTTTLLVQGDMDPIKTKYFSL